MVLKQLQFQRQKTRSTPGLAQPSEARHQTVVLGLAMLLVPSLLLLFYFKTRFSGLTQLDALDFAQIGRNLSEGHGFVTKILRPLALTHGNDPLNQPDVTHSPLFPFLLALFFGALGAKDVVAAGVSALFYLLTIPAVYFLGARMFSRPVGLLTVVIFAFNPMILGDAISGLHNTLYIFLMTCLLSVLYNLAVSAQVRRGQSRETVDEETHPIRKAGEPIKPVGKARIKPKHWTKGTELPKASLILAGVLTGLLYLTDPIFFWIIPVMLGAVAMLAGTRRWQALLHFAAPLCLLAFPWMYRNATLTGNPVFGLRGLEIWMHTRNAYPGLIAYRMLPNDLVPSLDLFKAVVQKMLIAMAEVIERLPQMPASLILAFFLPSLLFHFTNGAANILRRILMSCFGALLFGLLLFDLQMQFLISLLPVMLIFSVAYLLHLIQQVQLQRMAMGMVTALLAIVVFFPLAIGIPLADKTPPLAEVPAAQTLGQTAKPGEVVLSDQPWVVAWYADRPSIWLPTSDAQIGNYRNQFTGTQWLFLTDNVAALSPSWNTLYQGFEQFNSNYKQYLGYRYNYIQTHPEGAITLSPAQPTPPQLRFDIAPKDIDKVQPPLFRPLVAALNGLTAMPNLTLTLPAQPDPTLTQDEQKQSYNNAMGFIASENPSLVIAKLDSVSPPKVGQGSGRSNSTTLSADAASPTPAK